MSTLSGWLRGFVRFLVIWLIDGFSLVLTSWILPGVSLAGSTFAQRLAVAIAAALAIGIVNLLIRPVLLLLARPLGFVAVFIVGFVVNAVVLLVAAWLMPMFSVSGFFTAFIASLLFTAINVIILGLLEVNEDGSYYNGVIERRAKADPFKGALEPGSGLVMMEIDGLSYHHIKKALDDGLMPHLARLIATEGYTLTRTDCGLPSQTSACQAGIMFGDNTDIPAFRWYDKTEGRLIVSSKDASVLNKRYAHGGGLMRGGSSINNMLNGDAEKSMLTLSALFDGTEEEKKRRAQDVFLLLLNPYFLLRTVTLFFGDAARDVWQGWQQKRKDVQPRLNRLHHGYPFVRAATNVLMRDLASNLVMLDVLRGAPSIYMTWPGYDEIAHHSGPWTSDAFGALHGFDDAIERVHRTILTKATRPYTLLVLSDHGQSFGPTFKMRYGMTIKEFIEKQLPSGTVVSAEMGGDTGAPSLHAVSAELQNVADQGVGGATGKALAKQGHDWVTAGAEAADLSAGQAEGAPAVAQVTAYGSGNLAQVYFDLYPRKILLSELETAYPGMIAALIGHEGIGLVCGYDDDGTPVALGKTGKRNLETGEISGDDPLIPYAPSDPKAYGQSSVEVRAWQCQRVMNFPHAGDLMVISTVYPDGTVAALEELIGNHGGLGGEQTDAFVFHPSDMPVGETRNSADVFTILNNRRGAEVRTVRLEDNATDDNEWTWENLWGGLKQVQTWLFLAARAFLLDYSAYRTIASDRRMTAPGILIGVFCTLLVALVHISQQASSAIGASSLAGFFAAGFIIFIAGRLLSPTGHFTRTLRTFGFAMVTLLIGLLGLIPVLREVAAAVALLAVIAATWMAAAAAHEVKGWRTVIFPVVYVLAALLVPAVIAVLVSGAQMGLDAILSQLGIILP